MSFVRYLSSWWYNNAMQIGGRRFDGLKRWVLVVVGCYRRYISPFLAPRCRYYPTCSCYVRTAFLSHRLDKACILSLKRLLSCHPFGGSGVDFVPVPLYLYVYYPTNLKWQPPFLQNMGYLMALNHLIKL